MLSELNLTTVADVARVCDTPQATLEKIIANPQKYYGSFEIPKDNGESRMITPSLGVLKRAQTWLLDHFNAHVVWSKAVQGGVKKRSILTNAIRHVGKFCVATMDISSFFPSTKSDQIVTALLNLGCGPEASEYIAKLTTFAGVLPQGAPTSTLMGNLVLRRMDYEFIKLSQRHDLTYSRYVDDITISGPVRLNDFLNTFSSYVIDAGFCLSPNKTKIRYRHEQQIVTGLLVNDRVAPSAKYLSDLRRTIRCCWPDAIGASVMAAAESLTIPQFRESLWGKVNFIRSIKPSLFQAVRALMVKAVLTDEVPTPVASLG